MPDITLISNQNKAVGLKVATQFDLETSEKLFKFSGPKNLEWKYPVSGGNAPSADVIAEHVEKVKAYVAKNWRSKFKTDVKKNVVKEMKPLEKLYKANSEKAKNDKEQKKLQTNFIGIASAKAEEIITTEFKTFMTQASDSSIKALGQKGSKLKKAAGILTKGTVVIGVSVVSISASISTLGLATIPALTAAGVVIAALTTTGTIYKTYQASRKQFREAQKKLVKSKSAATKAIEAALTDAKDLKQKWDKVSLRQNNLVVKIEELDALVKKLGGDKSDTPQVKKLNKEIASMRDDLKGDADKLGKMSAKDPKEYVDLLETALKSIRDKLDIEEQANQQGRMDNAFGAVGQANNLANAIGALASA